MAKNTHAVAITQSIQKFLNFITDVLSKFRNLSEDYYTLKQSNKPRPVLTILEQGILQGDRLALAQAITLVESKLDEDKKLTTELFEKIIPATGNSIRVGITGVPGVGKSTFIETFGKHITSEGKKLAVLTVDPSSQLTRGSILGDKTRMEGLSKNPLAYIRPSPSGNSLGGVTNKTHEVMLLCEAAGYEVLIIETVGVGQSEVSVKNSVDFFLLLVLAGAGDELQGIKKGITELAHAVAITKADGDHVTNADNAKIMFQNAFQTLPLSSTSGWVPKVLTTSAQTGLGIKEIWNMILEFKEQASASGYFLKNRAIQNIAWFNTHFDELLNSDVQRFKGLGAEKKLLEDLVGDRKISAQLAAEKLLQAYHHAIVKGH